MGFEPMNTGFADQRVSHFATGAHVQDAMPGRACRRIGSDSVQHRTRLGASLQAEEAAKAL